MEVQPSAGSREDPVGKDCDMLRQSASVPMIKLTVNPGCIEST